MWTLTGFADEIAPELPDQLALLNTLGIAHLEFRSAWGVKILDLTDDQLRTAADQLAAAGVRVSSIGSDLGKIGITDDFAPHLERVRHAVDVAHFFDCPYIRVFSFFMPEGADPTPYRDEVLSRTRAMVEVAAAGGVTLLHENEKDIYGDVPSRVVDLFEQMDSPHYRGVFDPANYVQCGVRPFDEAYPLVASWTDYLHIKDALADEFDAEGLNKVVPAGEGDGQVAEVLRAFRADGYDGFLSLEPHLAIFSAFGASTGGELWTRARNALVSLLDAERIPWQ